METHDIVGEPPFATPATHPRKKHELSEPAQEMGGSQPILGIVPMPLAISTTHGDRRAGTSRGNVKAAPGGGAAVPPHTFWVFFVVATTRVGGSTLFRGVPLRVCGPILHVRPSCPDQSCMCSTADGWRHPLGRRCDARHRISIPGPWATPCRAGQNQTAWLQIAPCCRCFNKPRLVMQLCRCLPSC